jgi:hypothetical protein
MKKICYTVIFGSTDNLKEPKVISPGWEYICYTDDPSLKSEAWDVKVVESENPRKTSRYYKTHPPQADLTLFIDATFQIKRQLDPFALSKTEGIWLNSHPQRQCIYEEAQIVIEKGLDSEHTVNQQVTKYREDGYPEQNGLYRCGILVRNGSDKQVQKLNETWWEEIENGTWRDQVSFPYACKKVGITPNTILHGITNIYFKQSLHQPHPTDTWKYIGEGNYDITLTEKYQGAHLIILKNGLLFPQWINNYISLKDGKDRFIELIKILGGVVVYG